MALKATVYKAELQISDMDRHYYASHTLTLAQHPSETAARLMVRLVTFALYADELLRFGKGLSADDEPDLWNVARDGQIDLWVDLGQPDLSRVRKAAGRARTVAVVGYSGRGFALWWEKNASDLERIRNLQVLAFPDGSADALAALLDRSMAAQCLIEDGTLAFSTAAGEATITPIWHQGR